MDRQKKAIKEVLQKAGIAIDGKNPWDMQIHDERFYNRVLTDGSIGAGESYMDGWWDADQLEETAYKANLVRIPSLINKNPRLLLFIIQNKFLNVATIKRSYIVGKQHYDVGNELYERMLDHELNYTCGYWKDLGDPLTAWKKKDNLDKAQIAKMDLVCRKLKLKKGMKVFETGCGFGNFARFAAANYGVSVVGCTVSGEQARKARERCKGLPVKIYHKDYRELNLNEKFDRVASIGIMEHITHKNYDNYLKITSDVLKDDGLMLLHTIAGDLSVTAGDPWSDKYIFPNSHPPSLAQIAKASEGKFIIEDVQNFGLYYYTTLMSWMQNFDKSWKYLSKNYPEKYDERFYRMWKFYLLSFAGAFKARTLSLMQVVLSKGKEPIVYEAVR